MDTFSLLSKEIQKKVWELGWTYFTPIQEATIPAIMQTDQHVIISSGTASGKTEAAFLPILSLVGTTAHDALKVLYISPLKALINNQFERIQELSEHLEIPIHRWHGDVDQHKKKALTKNPSGVLQITPESLESLFINRTQHLHRLFSEIEFVVIDEIHAFLDNERGVQLRSLLSRMNAITTKRMRIVGLSATLQNTEFVKRWVAIEEPHRVEVIEAKNSDKELFYSLMHFPKAKDGKMAVELFEDLYEVTKDVRAIIFCNSRGSVEETTVFLNRLAEKEGRGETYLAHHSSIDKKEREYVEKTLAHAREPKSVVATSSLELGIDIGSIELVVQMDSTFTVSSLKQRLGRSGRTQDASQYLQLYATEPDGLLQALAVMELNLAKWMEPSTGYKLPFDVLFHQILSICGESNGIKKEVLVEKLKKNEAFFSIMKADMESLIAYMIEKEQLEVIPGSLEVIVGIEGERILRSKEFYAVFTTEEVFDVLNGSRKIGELDKKFELNIGDHVMLTGKLWRVVDIDVYKNKMYVEKAVNAKKPRYYGGPESLNPHIAEKMFEIATSHETFDYINEEALYTLDEIRKQYHLYTIQPYERVIWQEREESLIEFFTGSNITYTLILMLRSLGAITKKPDKYGRIAVSNECDIVKVLQQMNEKDWVAEDLLPHVLDTEWYQSKFTEYIPRAMKERMHIVHRMDVQGATGYLQRYEFRLIT